MSESHNTARVSAQRLISAGTMPFIDDVTDVHAAYTGREGA